MKKPAFLNFRGIIALIVILAVFDLGVAYLLGPAAAKAVESIVTRLTPAKFEIGRVELHPLLLRVAISDVRVYDPDHPELRIFKGDRLFAALDPLAVLSRRAGFWSVTVEGAELEVTHDEKGGFNIARLAKKDGKPEGKLEMLKKAVGLKDQDWFKRVYNGVRDALKRKAEARREKPVERTSVRELPKGRIVQFKTRPKPLLEVGSFELKNAAFVLKDAGRLLPSLRNVNSSVKSLCIAEGGAVSFASLKISGKAEGARPGSFDIELDEKKDAFTSKVDIRNVYIGAFEPLYAKSLPVFFERGFLTLKSSSHVTEAALESKNHVKLEDHRLAARMTLGVLSPVSEPVLAALNSRQSFELDFDIGGTPDKPSFSGFRKSLMDLVKDDLVGGMDKSLKEKASDLKDKAGEKLGELGGKIKELF